MSSFRRTGRALQKFQILPKLGLKLPDKLPRGFPPSGTLQGAQISGDYKRSSVPFDAVNLPPEFRNNVFEYRKLKRLINQTVSELDSLGLAPSILRSFQEQGDLGSFDQHTIVYEIVFNSAGPEPRLRLASGYRWDVGAHHITPPTAEPIYHVDFPVPERSLETLMRGLLRPPCSTGDENKTTLLYPAESNFSSDTIIPLHSDTAFFHLLKSTLTSLSAHLETLQDGFILALTSLAASISSKARPTSSSAPRSFSAYSITADNSMTLRPRPRGMSDLCAWREIFRLYAEAEIFESIRESTKGERCIEEMEKQLQLFKGRIQDKKVSLVLPGSSEALDAFFNLNLFILDVTKFQFANSEATRKILKKHTKRTTLPIPSYLLERITSSSSFQATTSLIRPPKSLPRLLVQAIGEVLLPIVPHIDDYTCLICFSIAFKPIRLCCGHFFCVRCLVKMQKRHMPKCPMCRAPTVLEANPSNIDYGLLNFMADWFPIESLEKLRVDDREVIREQMEVFGITDTPVCRIM